MWIFGERRIVFHSLKFVQIFFTIVVLVLEIVQYALYVDISPDSPDFMAVSLFRREESAKIWVYIVLLLTLTTLGMYVYDFKKIWKKGPYVLLDLSLAGLWFTSAMANLDPVYHHSFSVCSVAETSLLTSICNVWAISVVFFWMNLLTLITSAFMSWRIRCEKSRALHKPTVKPEVKKRLSQRQSVLLKQGLENPDQSQPVMLESGIKPLMLVQLAKE